MNSRCSFWFCSRCGHIYTGRGRKEEEAELRYGAEQNEAALYRAFWVPEARNPEPAGEVKAFFNMRLTTNVINNDGEKEESSCLAVLTPT